MTALANQIAEAIDNNMHTEAAMIGARAMNNKLGNAFLTVLEEIDAMHFLQGHLEKEQQQLRDLIADQINDYLVAMSLIK